MEVPRNTYLISLERAIRSDNVTNLNKALKLEERLLDSELEEMMLPKSLLHFCIENLATNCLEQLLTQTMHNPPDINEVYKGETLLTRLILITSVEQKRQKEMERKNKSLQMGARRKSTMNPMSNFMSKANTNAVTQATRPPQELAFQIMEFLLRQPTTDPNAARSDGWTPLMLACYLGNAEACEHLLTSPELDEDSYNDAYNRVGGPPSESVASSKVSNVSSYYPDNGLNPVHIAAANGHTKTVETLVNMNDDVLFTCEYGTDYDDIDLDHCNTPFMMAAMNSQTETAEKLLKLQMAKMVRDLDKLAPIKLRTNHTTSMKSKMGNFREKQVASRARSRLEKEYDSVFS